MQPRSTVRLIVEVQPRYGILYLSTLYALQAFFYAANYASLALSFSMPKILLASCLMSPVLGMIWLTFMSYVFQWTGRLLGGTAKQLHLASALAWSKLPQLLFIPFWLAYLFFYPEEVFILGAGEPSPILLTALAFGIGLWSQLLRIQALRELQGFSFLRALVNAALGWFMGVIAFFGAFCLLRFFAV